jgi:hypothetical protein
MRAFIVSPAATALLALGDAAVPSKLREPALVAVYASKFRRRGKFD